MNDPENTPEDSSINTAAADAADALEREREAHRAFRENLNHKLRTPLNAILGYAELLALQPRATDKDADVQQILRSARELLAVIERELAETTECAGARTAEPQTSVYDCDVLYVEDDPVNFTLVERILEYRPALRVRHAPHGRAGLEMAALSLPKLILLDLNLPDMHGSEVLQQLQQDARTANIPVVILSANATPSQIERLLMAGARNYLTKPFNLDPFLAVVDEFTTSDR